ncbi:MAG: 1-(5-phosphoribosyl)-5-[(5-phosphoribosylamino)methylideneamino]imidazole-4-carboxamide isomerase [Dehalococcoidales bacterium]|nr:1-(5-phosphoribosyl)-5-[(5-phosphoribosylamino)methylideneamino]imidazole-4-carboxamide isomerase [Dehalococcoidales bacterium]
MYQGAYDQETIFSDDPLDMALKWQSQGASRLHIVDLDGAAAGEVVNLEIIRQLASAMMIPTQLGGGIRSLGTIQEVLKLGIDRIILGTAAVEDPKLVAEACRRFGSAIIVSLDAREGFVAIRGWQQETVLTPIECARSLMALGVKRFIYTDINRDGTLTEPNFTAIHDLVTEIQLPVIAAGGISSLSHLKILKQLGAEGAIIGQALYSGDINLKQAQAAVS